MSFLKEFSLPVDMSQFLPPSDAFLQTRLIPQRKNQQEVQQGVKRKVNEDLGVSITRGAVFRKTSPYLLTYHFPFINEIVTVYDIGKMDFSKH